MKTLSDLNNKWWYRLIKVLFIFLYVFSVIGVSINMYMENRPYKIKDYVITCNYGSKEKFVAYKDKNIFIPSDYKEGLNGMPESVRKEIQQACKISELEVKQVLDDSIQKIRTGGESEFDGLWSETQITYTVGSRLEALFISVFSSLGVVILLEILKRALYYIILGSVNPKKN